MSPPTPAAANDNTPRPRTALLIGELRDDAVALYARPRAILYPRDPREA